MTEVRRPETQIEKRSPLGFDEFVAILVALLSLGSVFFWVLSRKPIGVNLSTLKPSSQSGQNKKNGLPNVRQILPGLVIPLQQTRDFGTTAKKLDNLSSKPSILSVIPSETESASTVVPEEVNSAPKIAKIGHLTTTRETNAAPLVPTSKAKPSPTTKNRPLPLVVVPVIPTLNPSQKVKFSDVRSDYWASDYIFGLQQKGIVGAFLGGYFRPNQLVNRAEFAAILEKSFGTKITNNPKNFPDVTNSFWAAPAIKKATESKFFAGYPDQTFRPENPIPKVQAIVVLATGLNLPEPANPEQILQQKYKDAAQIPAYARKKVAAATLAGIVVNHPNSELLKPNQNATRADIAALVYQAMAKQGKVQKKDSKFLVKP